MKTLAIVGGSIVLMLLIGWSVFGGTYNKLTLEGQRVDSTWATVETQYQRRFDLIDNLVASVKGAQGQELAVFTAIADARKQYTTATTQDGKVEALNTIQTNLALIPRLQEAYPELRSNDTLNRLMDEITGTENRIQIARDRYNNEVLAFNSVVKVFPTNLIAGMYGFEARTFFKSADGSDVAPKVNFDK